MNKHGRGELMKLWLKRLLCWLGVHSDGWAQLIGCEWCAKGCALDTERDIAHLQDQLAAVKQQLTEERSRVFSAETLSRTVTENEVLRTRLALAERCAEVLATFTLVTPATCDPKREDLCDDEMCGLCRAIEACEPYLDARNAREDAKEQKT